MGKRASKRKPPPKKKMGKVASKFPCPFCSHEESCEVELHQARKVGVIKCKVCSESFQTKITYLSEPIDVYTDWIDECDRVNAIHNDLGGRQAPIAQEDRLVADGDDRDSARPAARGSTAVTADDEADLPSAL